MRIPCDSDSMSQDQLGLVQGDVEAVRNVVVGALVSVPVVEGEIDEPAGSTFRFLEGATSPMRAEGSPQSPPYMPRGG